MSVRAYFGRATALSGNLAVAGAASQSCTSGNQCGAVYVRWIDGSHPDAKLLPSTVTAANYYGSAVAASGEVVIGGAPVTNCKSGEEHCGAAYVHRFNGVSWDLEATLNPVEVANSWFGEGVAMDGNVAVIGAYSEPCAAGITCGAVYVYRFNGTAWNIEARLTTPEPVGPAEQERFGQFLTIEEDLIAISSRVACELGTLCGAVYFFRFDGEEWVFEEKIVPKQQIPEASFGTMSLRGDRLLVGAPGEECDAGIRCGAAYLFQRVDGAWAQQARLVPLDRNERASFGGNVAMTDAALFVHGRRSLCGEVLCDAVYMFTHNGVEWMQQHRMTQGARDRLGWALSAEDDLLMAGASDVECSDGEAGCGAVSFFDLAPVDCSDPGLVENCPGLYDCDGSGLPDVCALEDGALDCNANGIPDDCDATFGPSEDCNDNGVPDECDVASETSFDCDEDGIPDECRGPILDCNNNGVSDECDILIDATSDDCNYNLIPDTCEIDDGSKPDCDGDGLLDECAVARVESTTLLASDGAAEDRFGASVALEGNVALIGATADSCDDGAICGAAYVFRNSGEEWIEEAKLVPSLRVFSGDRRHAFGTSVALGGEFALVGSPRSSCQEDGCGLVGVFRHVGGAWIREAPILPDDPVSLSSQYFGISVDIDNDLVVVGDIRNSCEDDSYSGRCGAAYVFRYAGGTWVQDARIKSPSPEQYTEFGIHVALSGDVIVVGAFFVNCGEGDPNPTCGEIYIYRRDAIVGSLWNHEATIVVPVLQGVATDGAMVLAASYRLQSTLVFRHNGSDWIPQPAIPFATTSIAIDKDLVALGTRLYRQSGSGEWWQEAVLRSPNPQADGSFGEAVALSDGLILVGESARFDDSQPGAAYIQAFADLDCDNNGVPDICDDAGPLSADCNNNGIADLCEIGQGLTADCNDNGVPDECEIGTAEYPDCNGNAVIDSCELSDGQAFDCNDNGTLDACDIDDESSPDVNGDGIPDECCLPCHTPPAPLTPPPLIYGAPLKNRFISMLIPPAAAAGVVEKTAIRVVLTTLNRRCSAGIANQFDPCSEDADCPGGVCDKPFAAKEGAVRYVNLYKVCDGTIDGCLSSADCGGGPCVASLMCPDDEFQPGFFCAVLGCEPEFRDWAGELAGAVLEVFGEGIVPARSAYDVAQLPAACCQDDPANCAFTSPSLRIVTARWGDLNADGATNAQDIARASNKLTVPPPGAFTKPRIMLVGSLLKAHRNVSVLELQNTIDAVSSIPQTGLITGPQSCPND